MAEGKILRGSRFLERFIGSRRRSNSLFLRSSGRKSGALGLLAGGKSKVEVGAKDIRELFRKLAEQYPGLEPWIERGIAVAIDGVIYRDTWGKKLPQGAEIFLPRTGGSGTPPTD